jgi:hypothetical protein
MTISTISISRVSYNFSYKIRTCALDVVMYYIIRDLQYHVVTHIYRPTHDTIHFQLYINLES